LAFAKDEDRDVEGAKDDCEDDVAVAAAADEVASAEADVDCNPWAVPLFDVAVVTVAVERPPPCPCPCPCIIQFSLN